MDIVAQMKKFFDATSVAIIGVPRDTGPGALNTLESMIKHGFSGKIYPINPNSSEIAGRKTYANIKDVPDDVDLAVVSVSRPAVLRAVNECVDKGIKAIIVVGQGFRDADDDGKVLQSELESVARRSGTRILGPNTFGVANAFNNLNTAYTPWRMGHVPIGTICQTGMLFSGLPRLLLVGKCLDIGNACDVDFCDGLEYFEDDCDIKLVCLHVEGVKEGRRFMEVARRVAKKKPILALKAGRTPEGRRVIVTHTGSMGGEDQLYQAAFKQCGIVQVADFDEMEDLTRAFLRLPPMLGSRLGVATASGGAGVLAVDAAIRYNLTIAELSPETVATIKKAYPAHWTWQPLSNPVDLAPVLFSTDRPDFAKKCESVLVAMLSDKNVDGVLILTAASQGMGDRFDLCQAVGKLVNLYPDKPLACWLYGPDETKEIAADFEERGNTVVFPTVERAVRTLGKMIEYQEFLHHA